MVVFISFPQSTCVSMGEGESCG